MTATIHVDDTVFVTLTDRGESVLAGSGHHVQPDRHGHSAFRARDLFRIFGDEMERGGDPVFVGSHVHLIHPKG